jgi:purine nucleoside phosphorylase
VSGPTYETRGEAALLAGAGACVVGMSTVPEVVAARDEGMRVLVLSLVTNMVVGVVSGTGVRSIREELDTEVRVLLCWGEREADGWWVLLDGGNGGGEAGDADCVA